MRSDIATSILVLVAEGQRLDALLVDDANSAATGSSACSIVRLARDQLSAAIKVLGDAVDHIDAATASASLAARPTLVDRIILIEPGDTFRTKLKLKSIERSSARSHSANTTDQDISTADDLICIRGIDRALAGQLASHGVKSFDQIASWERDDVRRISSALNLGRQISRQNWIEQAALLRLSSPTRLQKPAPLVVDRVPAISVQATAIATPQEAIVAVAPTAAAPPSDMQRPSHDRLTLIKGLSSPVVGLLADGGVNLFAEIAAWRAEDIANWQAKLGNAARIAKDGWFEQAALLASGHITSYAKDVDGGFLGALVSVPDDEPLPPPLFSDWSAPAPIAGLVEPEHDHPIAQPAVSAPVVEAEIADEINPGDATGVATEIAAVRNNDTALSTTLDRVTALERELVSLVANDTAAASAHAFELAAPHHCDRQTPALVATDPDGASFPDHTGLHEPFTSEADVVIVRRTDPSDAGRAARNIDAAPSTRSHAMHGPGIEDTAPETYAAYRDRAEEANVEIICSVRAPAIKRPVNEDKLWVRPGTEQIGRPISRLIRSLIRRN